MGRPESYRCTRCGSACEVREQRYLRCASGCGWFIRAEDYGVQTLYEKLNRSFWDGKLPHYQVSLVSRKGMGGRQLGSTYDSAAGAPTIYIRKDVHRLKRAEGKTVREILLHEICHVVNRKIESGMVKEIVRRFERPEIREAIRRHERPEVNTERVHWTKEFQAELRRLADQGERWAAVELRTYQGCSALHAEALRVQGKPLDRFCGDAYRPRIRTRRRKRRVSADSRKPSSDTYVAPE